QSNGQGGVTHTLSSFPEVECIFTLAPLDPPVKLWQLNGTDYEPQWTPKQGSETRFSSWTPLTNKQSNLQVRTTLLYTSSSRNNRLVLE
ncbi:hypothetical protein GOODEAATRI_004987, partial [Goodea atripinnis]